MIAPGAYLGLGLPAQFGMWGTPFVSPTDGTLCVDEAVSYQAGAREAVGYQAGAREAASYQAGAAEAIGVCH